MMKSILLSSLMLAVAAPALATPQQPNLQQNNPSDAPRLFSVVLQTNYASGGTSVRRDNANVHSMPGIITLVVLDRNGTPGQYRIAVRVNISTNGLAPMSFSGNQPAISDFNMDGMSGHSLNDIFGTYRGTETSIISSTGSGSTLKNPQTGVRIMVRSEFFYVHGLINTTDVEFSIVKPDDARTQVVEGVSLPTDSSPQTVPLDSLLNLRFQ